MQIHCEGHLKGWALKIETFLGPEKAMSEASAIWAQKVYRDNPDSCALIYRPSFRENKPKDARFQSLKTIVLALWACFRDNWVYIRALDIFTKLSMAENH